MEVGGWCGRLAHGSELAAMLDPLPAAGAPVATGGVKQNRRGAGMYHHRDATTTERLDRITLLVERLHHYVDSPRQHLMPIV